MKLENIKTRAEFYEFADIWYQRAHKLRDVWQNKKETKERRARALKLWIIMYQRINKLIQIAIKLNQPKH